MSKYEDTLLLNALLEILSGDKSAKTNKFNSLSARVGLSPKSSQRVKKSKAADAFPLIPSKEADRVKTMRAKYLPKGATTTTTTTVDSMEHDRLRDLLRDMLRDLLRDLLRDYMRDFKRDLFKLYEESSI